MKKFMYEFMFMMLLVFIAVYIGGFFDGKDREKQGQERCIQRGYEIMVASGDLNPEITQDKVKVIYDKEGESCIVFNLEGKILSQIPVYRLLRYIVENDTEKNEEKRQESLFFNK